MSISATTAFISQCCAGEGLYAQAGLINHAFHPNCVTTFIGQTLLLRAKVNISSGEELTINYRTVSYPHLAIGSHDFLIAEHISWSDVITS